MKKLLLVTLLSLLSIFSMPPTMEAQTRITATITLNTSPYPTNGDTVTVNGSVRTWVNATPTVTQILEDPTIGGCATNMFDAFSANGFTGPLYLAQPSSNVITLQGQIGQALTVTLSPSGIGSVTYYSQTVVSGVPVVVPITSEIQSTTAVMIASELVTNLNTLSTNPFTANLLPPSAVTNNETGVTLGGNIAASTATNAVNFSGALAGDVTGTQGGVVVNTSQGNSIVTNHNAADVWLAGKLIMTNGSLSVLSGGILSSGGNITASGGGNIVGTTIIGAGTGLTGTITGVTLQGETFSGTNNWTGDIAYPLVSIGTLANGENADLPISTNIYVTVSGPTGAFAIDGIAEGRSGRLLIVENATGQQMTIRNNSGLDATPANRIATSAGADLIMSNNPCMVLFAYDGSAQRWTVAAYNSPSTTLGGNIIANLASNVVSGITITNAVLTGSSTVIGTLTATNAVIVSNATDKASFTVTSNLNLGPSYGVAQILAGGNIDNPVMAIDGKQQNVWLGNNAGGSPAALSHNTNNTAVGFGAFFNDTGGAWANTCVGASSLGQLNGGSNNIAIGYGAGSQLQANESGNIYIGNQGNEGENNVIRIGAGQTDTFLVGNVHGNFRHTSAYTLVNATVQSNAVAHNLGATPSVVRLVLACVANDAASGFQAGQEMNAGDFIDNSGNSVPACTAWADATNVYLYFDGCVQSSINLKGNGGISSMTNFAMKAYFAP